MNSIINIFAPVFALLGIVIIFNTIIKMSVKKNEKKKSEFIENEREAAFYRSKPIEEERYIKPNIENFKVMDKKENYTDEELYVYNLQQKLIEISQKTMAHFTESNIELKKMYGINNLESIIQWEENYTNFLHKANSFAKALNQLNKKEEAIKILEEAIRVGLDFPQSLIFLADIYNETNNKEKLENLYQLTKQNNNNNMIKVVTHIEKLLTQK